MPCAEAVFNWLYFQQIRNCFQDNAAINRTGLVQQGKARTFKWHEITAGRPDGFVSQAADNRSNSV